MYVHPPGCLHVVMDDPVSHSWVPFRNARRNHASMAYYVSAKRMMDDSARRAGIAAGLEDTNKLV
jgi:hypothetical protein